MYNYVDFDYISLMATYYMLNNSTQIPTGL